MALTLDDIRTAIAKLVNGAQSWSANGVVYTRADLSKLREIEKDLEAKVGIDGTGRRMFERGRLFR